MKKLALISICWLLLGTMSMSQEPIMSKNDRSQTQTTQELIYEPVEVDVPNKDLTEGGGYATYFYYGNPSGMFLEKEWTKGSAILTDGNELEGSFRYNLYAQKMEAVVEGDTFAIAKPSELEMLKMGDRKFVYISYIRGDYEVANSWFELLDEGNINLLLRRYIKYQVIDDDDDDPSNDKLYKVREYYVMRKGMEVERMPLSKDAIKKVLADHETEVCDYLKAEKLKFKVQDDLVKLFAYYNSLD